MTKDGNGNIRLEKRFYNLAPRVLEKYLNKRSKQAVQTEFINASKKLDNLKYLICWSFEVPEAFLSSIYGSLKQRAPSINCVQNTKCEAKWSEGLG